MSEFLRRIRIVRSETRPSDAWYDLSLRQLRNGEVVFYRVRDFLTGDWLFKICNDVELGKVLVKAVKCPAGPRFAQLEGNTMVFQQSVMSDKVYDVVSLTRADEDDKLSRKIADNVDVIPAVIRENYEIRPYEEATGKKAPGKHLVTLSNRGDEKAMMILFLLERAWLLSKTSPEDKLKALELEEEQHRIIGNDKVPSEIDTGQVWKCPICGDELRLKHIEKGTAVRHALKKKEP